MNCFLLSGQECAFMAVCDIAEICVRERERKCLKETFHIIWQDQDFHHERQNRSFDTANSLGAMCHVSHITALAMLSNSMVWLFLVSVEGPTETPASTLILAAASQAYLSNIRQKKHAGLFTWLGSCHRKTEGQLSHPNSPWRCSQGWTIHENNLIAIIFDRYYDFTESFKREW